MTIYKLGEIATVEISGVDKKTKDGEIPVKLCNFVDVYYKWAITSDLEQKFMEATARTNEIERFKLKRGQVALTKDSETRFDIGIATYIADDFDNVILGYHNALITPNPEKLSGKYLNALLHTDYARTYFANNASGSGQRYALSIDALNNFPVPLLPLAEQERIGDIFSSIDQKIALNRAINDNLEAMAKQLYDYWFVQFDFPNEEGKPYKSSGGKMIRNEKLKREIPEGWGDAKIKDIANTYSGGTPTSTNQDYYIGGKIPWINSGELNNPVITETSNYITDLGLNNSSAKLYPQNTILVALYGATAGKVSLLSFEACSNQAVCGVMPTDDNMTTYIRYHLASLYEHFIILSSGSARDNISQDTIKNTILPIPRIEILKKYEDIVKPIVDKIIANQKEVENLTKQRDELLPLLMNGQVSVNYHLYVPLYIDSLILNYTLNARLYERNIFRRCNPPIRIQFYSKADGDGSRDSR